METLCVNIGCGHTPTPGWRNFDNSHLIRLSKVPLLLEFLGAIGLCGAQTINAARILATDGVQTADATKRIPVEDGSVSVLYSSHVIEHLDRRQVEQFLAEARRVLRKGGIVRLAVPDLRRRVESYIEHGDADRFMESLFMQRQGVQSLLGKIKWLFTGDVHHMWMYDACSLKKLLESQGFEGAMETAPGETQARDAGALNLREREDESIYVEARRP